MQKEAGSGSYGRSGAYTGTARDIARDEELWRAWIADLLHITAEHLVFIVESTFNGATGWKPNNC